MLQDADRLEQVSGDLDLAGEVGWVGNNLLGLGLKLHLRSLVVAVLHGGLDARDLAVVIEHLVDVGVQHVGTAVDCRQTSEALGELTQTVQGVDVWRLAVAGHGVDVKANSVDCLDGLARLVNVFVRREKGHGMADKVPSVILQAELVINLLHTARTDFQAYIESAMISRPC